MPASRFSYSWSSGEPSAGEAAPRPPTRDPAEASLDLERRLAVLAAERLRAPEEVVAETSRAVQGWSFELPLAWSWRELGLALERGLEAWDAAQGWRGTCAVWLDALRRAWHAGSREPEACAPVERIAEELGLWAATPRDGATGDDPEIFGPWSGEPYAGGRRLASRGELAREAARELERGETILVAAHSDALALALEAAWRRGAAPEVWVAEGAPHFDGRILARRLARAGVAVRLGYDGAALAAVPRADRVWVPTEAVGAEAFLARAGTRALLEEARRLEVPSAVLATSDQLVPGGTLRTPAWCEADSALLWDDAPEGVTLETQAYERVPLDLVDRMTTERGSESPAALALRGLRVEAAPACGAGAEHAASGAR